MAINIDERNSTVTVRVNEQPVTLPTHRATGLQVKEAAIVQGVAIEVDFVLSLELGGGKARIIGDADEVELHKDSAFLAIPPDDNS